MRTISLAAALVVALALTACSPALPYYPCETNEECADGWLCSDDWGTSRAYCLPEATLDRSCSDWDSRSRQDGHATCSPFACMTDGQCPGGSHCVGDGSRRWCE